MACSSWLRETARELMIMMEHCRACGVEVLVSNSWSTLKFNTSTSESVIQRNTLLVVSGKIAHRSGQSVPITNAIVHMTTLNCEPVLQ